MIVEANPSDTGALETLKEIYTKLGDRENLARVVARLAGTVGWTPLRERDPGARAGRRAGAGRGGAASARDGRAGPGHAGWGQRPARAGQAERRRGGERATAGQPVPSRRSAGGREADHARAAATCPRRAEGQRGQARDHPGPARLHHRGQSRLLPVQAVRDPRDHGGAGRSGSGRAEAGARADRQEAQRAADQADGQRPHAGDGRPHQRLRARRRRLHDQPADPAGGRLGGGHPQGVRAPLRDRRPASPT